jgi:hypothetical protein
MTAMVLALGLLFTTASQLRLPGLPVGPGELCLAVWIAATAVEALVSHERLRARTVLTLLAFWAAFAVAMGLGMLVAMATGEEFESSLVLHDTGAYLLIAALGCLCAATPGRLRRVCWMLVACGALSLSLQLAQGAEWLSIPGIDPWYWERFRGWSDNPNQLSLVCLVLVLLSWSLADSAGNFGARLAALLCVVPPLLAGRMSQNDTFLVALIVALAVWLTGKLIVWSRRDRASLRATFAPLGLVAAPLLLLSFTPVVLSNAPRVGGFLLGFAKEGGAEVPDEVNLRLTLWHEALDRGIGSGMLGLGPGPHLQIPAEITQGRANTAQPGNVYHPAQNGTANYEAHNTLLDVFTQGGLLAVASLLWLLQRAARCVYRAGAAGLMSLFAGICVFMMTGNVIRQPVFWFALILCLTSLEWMQVRPGHPGQAVPHAAAGREAARPGAGIA